MVALHVVLRQDTLVGDLTLGQKILGVELLHQGIALVLFIAQDASHRIVIEEN